MVHNNSNNTENNKKLEIGLDGRFIYDGRKFAEKDYTFTEVSWATGDQFIKTAYLRSKDGSGAVSWEQVKEFREEAKKEAREWRRNHPGESITIRVVEDENGEQKQVIESTSKKDLICPSNFRSRIYDQNGNLIVGEENVRREIERREDQIEQFEKEGKMEVINHQIHHTDDGNTVSILTRVHPIKMVHKNEINDETKWIPLTSGVKKLESSEGSQQNTQETQQADENRISEISSEVDMSIAEKIKKNMNEWSVMKLEVGLSNGIKTTQECLVHDSVAKEVDIRHLGNLIYPVETLNDSERKELSGVLNGSLLENFVSSGNVEKLNLNKVSSLKSVENIPTTNNTTDKGKNTLIGFGVVSALADCWTLFFAF